PASPVAAAGAFVVAVVLAVVGLAVVVALHVLVDTIAGAPARVIGVVGAVVRLAVVLGRAVEVGAAEIPVAVMVALIGPAVSMGHGRSPANRLGSECSTFAVGGRFRRL